MILSFQTDMSSQTDLTAPRAWLAMEVFCKLYHNLMLFHCMTPTRLTARGVKQ